MVKWDAQPPEIATGSPCQDFLAEGLGPGIPAAVVLAEGEVWRIVFTKALSIGAPARIDAAAGDMAPGQAHFLAYILEHTRKASVALQAFLLLDFAGIHVGLAREAGRIDEEFGVFGPQIVPERFRAGVVSR